MNEQNLYNRYGLISNGCLVGEAKVYCDKKSRVAYLAWLEIYYPFRRRVKGKGYWIHQIDSSDKTKGF